MAEVARLKLLCLLDMMALHIGHASHDTNASVWSNVHCSTLYLNGIAVFHGNSAFLRDKPTTTTLKKVMLPSRAIMSAHGQKKILVRAVDEKQVISL